MKKLLFSAVSALAMVGVATAAESTEFAVLYVPSTAKETIVSVPWIESGTGNDVTNNAVKVADLVLTAGLQVGAELKYHQSGTNYLVWTLTEDSSGKHWEPGTTVTTDSQNEAPKASDQSVMRGQAIMLKRSETTITSGFYIMGKPSSNSVTNVLGAGYSLIAPPSATNCNVNAFKWTGITDNDKIIVPSKTTNSTQTLSYVGNPTRVWKKWRQANNKVSPKVLPGWEMPDPIEAGTGFWFVNSTDKIKRVEW